MCVTHCGQPCSSGLRTASTTQCCWERTPAPQFLPAQVLVSISGISVLCSVLPAAFAPGTCPGAVGGMLLPVGTMALLLQQPLQQDSLSQPDSSFLTIKGDKKVSQPFTVQYNRKIQEPLPVLHHSQALFRSRSLSLLQQHCSFCTRSLTLSPLTLHLLSLLLLFFPFLLGGAAEIKHSLPWLFLQALNCPNQSICFIPYTSFAHC